MPGFDGTGPRGQGAMTGGGRGYCALNLNSPEIVKNAGRKFLRRGAGRGNRNCFHATGLPGWMRTQRGMFSDPANDTHEFGGLSKEDELSALKSKAEYLKTELDAVEKKVRNLETK